MSTARIKEVIEDSKASADRSLALAERTKQTGINTVENLQHQGEQLKRAQDNVDEILYKQQKAARHIAVIDSIGGWVKNKFSLRRKKRNHVEEDNKKIKKEAKKIAKKERIVPMKVKSDAEMQEPIDYDLLDADDKQDLQHTNDTVEKISDVVDGLKEIALIQSKELDEHNQRLPTLKKTLRKAEINTDIQVRRISRQ